MKKKSRKEKTYDITKDVCRNVLDGGDDGFLITPKDVPELEKVIPKEGVWCPPRRRRNERKK